MKILLGFSESDSSVRMLEAALEQVSVQVAATREQLLFRMEDDFDAVAIDITLFASVYPWDMIRDIKSRQKHKQTEVIIIPNDCIYDSLMLELLTRLALEFGFRVTPLAVSENDRVLHLVDALRGKAESGHEKGGRKEGKIIACWSAGSRDGASTLALNTALALATHTTLRIGFLDLNLKNPSARSNLNFSDREKSNVRIRPRLQTQTLTPGELIQNCLTYRKLKRFYILPGTPRRESASDVTPEMIDHLLTTARNTFDLTFLDLNGYPDNAATICGVRGADIRLLVARPRFDSYRTGWGEWYDCYWKYCGLQPHDIQLVMNRTASQREASAAADFLDMPLAGIIPEASTGLGWKSVDEGIPLYYQTGAENFIDAIHTLAGGFARDAGMDMRLPDRVKQRLWSRITATLG
ncbi:MAG: hypothetical protein H7X86_01980 [Gorillibacterium sp.]|nr:hypothetical protein [Gorillibacterium sp.]